MESMPESQTDLSGALAVMACCGQKATSDFTEEYDSPSSILSIWNMTTEILHDSTKCKNIKSSLLTIITRCWWQVSRECLFLNMHRCTCAHTHNIWWPMCWITQLCIITRYHNLFLFLRWRPFTSLEFENYHCAKFLWSSVIPLQRFQDFLGLSSEM